MSRPLLAVDVDGVISLFGFGEPPERSTTRFQLVDGVPHCISLAAGERLRRLCGPFEMIWASGWEEKANFYLPQLLGLAECGHVSFDDRVAAGAAHWKLEPLDRHARGRALAWIDDNFDASCFEWAERRAEPTLLVPTESHLGLEEAHVDALLAWAAAL